VTQQAIPRSERSACAAAVVSIAKERNAAAVSVVIGSPRWSASSTRRHMGTDLNRSLAIAYVATDVSAQARSSRWRL